MYKSGKHREREGWCWAHAANVASLMCFAHCAKPSLSPWTAHIKMDVLDQQPGPHKPPDPHKWVCMTLIWSVKIRLFFTNFKGNM